MSSALRLRRAQSSRLRPEGVAPGAPTRRGPISNFGFRVSKAAARFDRIAVMILGHGIDVVEIPRLAAMVGRHGERFVERVFTPVERDYCRGRKREMEHLAGRFAAKEAVLKVLGTGWAGKISWRDIEVTNTPAGQPLVTLAGECARIAERMGIRRVLISISHTGDWAAASAIGVDDAAGSPYHPPSPACGGP